MTQPDFDLLDKFLEEHPDARAVYDERMRQKDLEIARKAEVEYKNALDEQVRIYAPILAWTEEIVELCKELRNKNVRSCHQQQRLLNSHCN